MESYIDQDQRWRARFGTTTTWPFHFSYASYSSLPSIHPLTAPNAPVSTQYRHQLLSLPTGPPSLNPSTPWKHNPPTQRSKSKSQLNHLPLSKQKPSCKSGSSTIDGAALCPECQIPKLPSMVEAAQAEKYEGKINAVTHALSGCPSNSRFDAFLPCPRCRGAQKRQ